MDKRLHMASYVVWVLAVIVFLAAMAGLTTWDRAAAMIALMAVNMIGFQMSQEWA